MTLYGRRGAHLVTLHFQLRRPATTAVSRDLQATLVPLSQPGKPLTRRVHSLLPLLLCATALVPYKPLDATACCRLRHWPCWKE